MRLQEREERQRYAGQTDRMLFITLTSLCMGRDKGGGKKRRMDGKVKNKMKAGDFLNVRSVS